MDNKYKLIPSDIEGLFRIKALKDFNDVKKGDIGGYVEGEKTLSQLGDCWIYDNAVVRDNAKVCDNAIVFDYAKVWGNAIVRDNARVLVNARVFGNTIIRDNAVVRGDARIRGHAVVQHDAVVRGEVRIFDNVIVCDNVIIGGEVDICGDAIISSDKDYIVFKNWWSSGRYFTWTRSNNMWKVGCFYGTGEQLINKAFEDSIEKGFEYKKIVDYVESILENQRLNYE